MNDFIGFMEVVGAILAAFGLAMGLEWWALNGMLRMMPARRERAQR